MLPIYSILNSNPEVHSLLFDGQRIRAWGYGVAPESEANAGPTVRPYAVWQIASDEPDNLLTCEPNSNSLLYQFDVYGRDGSTVDQINSALQSALRLHGFIQTIRHAVFEPDSKLFRAGFDFSFIQMR